jgi:hypothetical protein
MLFAERQDQSFGDSLVEEQNVELTASLLPAEAKRLGFNVYPANEKIYTQQDLDQEVAKRVKEQTSNTSDKPAGGGASAPAPVSVTSLYIHKGLDSSTISEILLRLKVISDAEAFQELMTVKKLNGKIQPGLKIFEGKLTPQQVIGIITKPE